MVRFKDKKGRIIEVVAMVRKEVTQDLLGFELTEYERASDSYKTGDVNQLRDYLRLWQAMGTDEGEDRVVETYVK